MRNIIKAVTAAVLLSCGTLAHAIVYDLTTAGATATDDGVKYTQVPPQSTGTGTFPSFVRIQGNTDFIHAYNTTVNNTLDNTADAPHNHELLFGDVGITEINGIEYVGFILDINQTGADPLLSLDDVQVFISSSPNQSVETFTASGFVNFASSALVYRLDGDGSVGSNDTVELNYILNSGSGSGDMELLIPYSLFSAAFIPFLGGSDSAAARNNTYVYLYSSFGIPNNNNDGFEEWAHFNGSPAGEPPCTVNCGPQIIPEPGTLALLGIALLGGLATFRRRSGRNRKAP